MGRGHEERRAALGCDARSDTPHYTARRQRARTLHTHTTRCDLLGETYAALPLPHRAHRTHCAFYAHATRRMQMAHTRDAPVVTRRRGSAAPRCAERTCLPAFYARGVLNSLLRSLHSYRHWQQHRRAALPASTPVIRRGYAPRCRARHGKRA